MGRIEENMKSTHIRQILSQAISLGNANLYDDRMLYTSSNRWLQQKYIMGRAVGFLPYVGWLTIIMTDKPIIKYILLGALGLLVITSKE